MSKWMVSSKKCDFKQIGEELGIDQVVVRIMRNRDMTDISQMKSFLYGGEELFHSYEYMKRRRYHVNIYPVERAQ